MIFKNLVRGRRQFIQKQNRVIKKIANPERSQTNVNFLKIDKDGNLRQ